MANNVVGRLRTDLICNTSQYVAGLKRAAAQTTAYARSIKSINGMVASFGRNLATIGGAGGLAGGYGFYHLIRSTEDFRSSLQSSIAIMGDLSSEVKTQLYEASRDVQRETKYTSKDAAESLFYLASAGLSAEQAIQSVGVVARFAQAGVFDMAVASDALVKSQDALGLSSQNAEQHMSQMARIADVVTKANVVSTASVEEFAAALQNRGAMAGRFGNMELEETMAFLMAFAQGGFAIGVEGGEMLWRVMRDLRTKAVENEEAFKALGVAVYDADGNVRGGLQTFIDLDKALEGLSSKAQTIRLQGLGFTDRALAPIMHLIGKSDDISAWTEAMKNAGGTMEDIASKQLTPFAKSCRDAKSAIVDLWDAMKGPEVTTGVAQMMTDWITGFRDGLDMLKNFDNLLDGSFDKFVDGLGGIDASIVKRYEQEYFKNNALRELPNRLKGKSAKLSEAEIKKLNVDPQAEAAAKSLKTSFDEFMQNLKTDEKLNSMGITDPKLRDYYRQFGGVGGGAAVDTGKFQVGLKMLQDASYLERTNKERENKEKEHQATMKRLANEGRRAFESTMNPFESFLREVDDLRRLLDAGAISGDTFTRATNAANKQLLDQFKQPNALPSYSFAPTAAAGSAEAYRTIMRSMHGGTATDPAQKTRLQQLEEMKRTARTLEQIREGMAETVEIE